MATSKRESRRSLARPIPGASWQARVCDAGEITARLNALWQRYGEARETTPTSPNGQGSDAPWPMVTARAATLNLIAATRTKADADRVRQTIASLSDIYPSRATVLIADPGQDTGTAPGMDVRVDLLEQAASRGRPAIVFECVTVDVSTENERQLASIASPLLVPDLPDFLWWSADTADGGSLFSELVSISDRLIVDSAASLHAASAMQTLLGFVCAPGNHAALSDFAWGRLTPWRRLTTQFFDVPAMLPILDLIDEATVTYANSPTQSSGFTSALLYAGWLGSRLNWRTPGELLPVRGDPNVWRATLRAGAAGRQREVTLTLRPTAKLLASSTLLDVRLAADGGKAGFFTIERLDADEISTTSDSPEMPNMVRTVFAPLPDEADLLGEELRDFGRDPVFEAALAFATDMVPEGFRGVRRR
ncbi:MAG: glucose-6-phosphate dehydrogenase assembly protein OpcA [Chloroflexi bacterium]|nr:glucose-6-phosphate dehydrogenase assembly protein OpcA [Chloroflexota bacterium]